VCRQDKDWKWSRERETRHRVAGRRNTWPALFHRQRWRRRRGHASAADWTRVRRRSAHHHAHQTCSGSAVLRRRQLCRLSRETFVFIVAVSSQIELERASRGCTKYSECINANARRNKNIITIVSLKTAVCALN